MFRGSRRHAEQDLDERFLVVVFLSNLDKIEPSLRNFKGTFKTLQDGKGCVQQLLRHRTTARLGLLLIGALTGPKHIS